MSVARASARVDLGAIRHNAAVLARAAGPARLMAVVKADGYGHGAVAVARAALEGGASSLAVAASAEAAELRAAGLEAPILLMGPLAGDEWDAAAEARAEVVVWTPESVERAEVAFARRGSRARVHLKLDTGMGRLGARLEGVAALAESAAAADVDVVGLMTHFATADEVAGENAAFMAEQLVRFRAAAAELRPRFPGAALPRGQLGRGPARPGVRLRHGALRHRPLRLLPLRRRSGRPRPAAGDVARLPPGGDPHGAVARERGLRAPLAGAARHPGRGRARGLRRRLRAIAVGARRRPGTRSGGCG